MLRELWALLAHEQNDFIFEALMTHRTPEDCAYAAGFFDGEGTIFIAENRGLKGARGPVYNMRVLASQVDPTPIHWLQGIWGGSIMRKLQRGGTKPAWEWVCCSRQAAVFLRDVRPYLQVKADEADVALEFQDGLFNPGCRGHTDEYRAWQQQQRSMLMELKRDKERLVA